jgi:hypothetical protein
VGNGLEQYIFYLRKAFFTPPPPFLQLSSPLPSPLPFSDLPHFLAVSGSLLHRFLLLVFLSFSLFLFFSPLFISVTTFPHSLINSIPICIFLLIFFRPFYSPWFVQSFVTSFHCHCTYLYVILYPPFFLHVHHLKKYKPILQAIAAVPLYRYQLPCRLQLLVLCTGINYPVGYSCWSSVQVSTTL